ncbi:MAG: GIY-YIG nuclease family protein [Lewinellaceae bacterium]|nr:GIY-YIG nuclease family protein [Saprospiraceae bacterium]MCB9313606.1 GIY-YIG nuclease family protein [Lewinellaceae bacterium]
MKDCFLYIQYSEAHDKYYVGQSEDVDTRLQFHNELSDIGYTSRFRSRCLILSNGQFCLQDIPGL